MRAEGESPEVLGSRAGSTQVEFMVTIGIHSARLCKHISIVSSRPSNVWPEQAPFVTKPCRFRALADSECNGGIAIAFHGRVCASCSAWRRSGVVDAVSACGSSSPALTSSTLLLTSTSVYCDSSVTSACQPGVTDQKPHIAFQSSPWCAGLQWLARLMYCASGWAALMVHTAGCR